MNTRDQHRFPGDAPPRPPLDPAEWEQQERGRRAAAQSGDAGPDPVTRGYRQVAQAVRSRPRSAPPADFAETVAREAAAREAGIERLLSRWLAVALVLVLGAIGVRYGASMWTTFQHALGSEASGWILAGLGCAGLSWVCTRVHAFGEQVRHTHPAA